MVRTSLAARLTHAAMGRRHRSPERGAIAVIVAVSMTVLTTATAASYDIGRLVVANRTMQSIADAAAYDAVHALTGQAAATVFPTACSAALANAAENGFAVTDTTCSGKGTNQLTLVLGNVSVPAVKCSISAPAGAPAGFCPVSPTDAVTVPNALEVTTGTTTNYTFVPGSGQSVRHSYVLQENLIGFTIGSWAAEVQTSFLNSLFGESLGIANIGTISAINYNGLVTAGVTVGQLLSANPSIGTAYNLLNTGVSPSTLLGWYYNALTMYPSDDLLGRAATTIQALMGNTTVGTTIYLCKLISISTTSSCGVSNTTPALSAVLNAMDYARLVAEAANGSNALTFSASTYNTDLPSTGLGTLTLQGSLISPMVVVPAAPYSSSGTPITGTNQQASFTLSLDPSSSATLLGLLDTGTVSVSLNVTAATATGTVTGVPCSGATSATIGVTAQGATIAPTVSVTTLGSNVPLTSATLNVAASSGSLSFTPPFTTRNQQNYPGLANVNLTVSGGGLVGTLVNTALGLASPVISNLNTALPTLMNALGVDIGGATLAATGVGCDQPGLIG